MNDQDKEAFENWEINYFGTGKEDNCPHYMSHIKATWQAACEYKQSKLAYHIHKIELENASLNQEIEKFKGYLEAWNV